MAALLPFPRTNSCSSAFTDHPHPTPRVLTSTLLTVPHQKYTSFLPSFDFLDMGIQNQDFKGNGVCW
jgi:hypothetical protein